MGQGLPVNKWCICALIKALLLLSFLAIRVYVYLQCVRVETLTSSLDTV